MVQLGGQAAKGGPRPAQISWKDETPLVANPRVEGNDFGLADRVAWRLKFHYAEAVRCSAEGAGQGDSA